jgi:hypothetical protein
MEMVNGHGHETGVVKLLRVRREGTHLVAL